MKKLGIYIILLSVVTRICNAIIEAAKLNEIIPAPVLMIVGFGIMVGLAILVYQNDRHTILTDLSNDKTKSC